MGKQEMKCDLPPAPKSEEERRERNRVLVRKMKDVLNDTDFPQFRGLIGEYVNNAEASADEFHSRSLHMLGPDHVHSMLLELIALLPDAHESKRQALLRVHRSWHKNYLGEQTKPKSQPSTSAKKKESSQPTSPSGDTPPRATVIAEEQDYPSLSGAPASIGSNALSVGVYNSRHQGRPTQEDFPALQSAAPEPAPEPKAPKPSNYGQSKNKKKRQQRKKTYL